MGVESTDKTVLCWVGVKSYCQGGNAKGVVVLENATDESNTPPPNISC